MSKERGFRMNEIYALSKKYFQKVSEIRHYLHENPELGFEEFKTSTFIKQQLDLIGIPYESVCETGVIAMIEGGYPGKTVLLRADIDAISVQEEVDIPFKSKTPGLMHACGHDGHAAGLLGAAMILNEIKDSIKGNIKLMFQPAEENFGGALPMIEAGILENPKVSAAFGLHLWGPLPKGVVALKSGPLMAAPDSFEVIINGKGCHAAMPHLGVDPILIASQAICEIQSIVSRKINPLIPSVVSICKISGGQAFNVIPENVTFGGTIRTFTDLERNAIPKYIKQISENVCKAHDATCEFNYFKGFPPLINDVKMTELARNSIKKIADFENVIDLEHPSMGGEDFAYLAQYVPSSFFFVGISDSTKEQAVHHHPKFSFDDDVLIDASAYLAQIAVDFLNEEN